jgi:hypothetical protein
MFTSELLAQQFPNAHYYAEWQLVTWFPIGVLDNETADHIASFLEFEEQIEGAHFNRYTDMTGHTRFEIELDHIVRLTRRRKAEYKGPPVKSALYVVKAAGLGIARMYEELMKGSQIELRVFRIREEAAEWLGVPIDILQPPNDQSA